MQFRLSTLFLLFVVLWSSLAMFGAVGGVVVFLLAIGVAIRLAQAKSLRTAKVQAAVAGGLVLLVVLLASAAQRARDEARRVCCLCPLKQLVMGLHNYNQTYGCFPPAYIADRSGKPIHSWRVLVLPFVDEAALYQQYNFNEPWDGPNNRKLLAARPRTFSCESHWNVAKQGDTATDYVAVLGRDAAWQGAAPKKFDDFHGKASDTILLVEAADAGIPWTQPRDLDLDHPPAAAATPSADISSHHISSHGFFFHDTWTGAGVALGDGSVKFLPAGAFHDPRFPSFLRVGGFRQEFQDAPWPDEPLQIHWPNCAAFAVWLASVGLLMFRAVRSRKPDAGRRPSRSLSPEQRSGDEANEIPLSRPDGPTVPLRDSTDAP
jgi:hypothetical protein